MHMYVNAKNKEVYYNKYVFAVTVGYAKNYGMDSRRISNYVTT